MIVFVVFSVRLFNEHDPDSLFFLNLIPICRLTFTCDELSGGCVVSKFKYGVREVD